MSLAQVVEFKSIVEAESLVNVAWYKLCIIPWEVKITNALSIIYNIQWHLYKIGSQC